MKDLQDEQLNRDNRIKHPLAPDRAGLSGEVKNKGFGEQLAKVLLDTQEGMKEDRHRWPPVGEGDKSTTILTGGRSAR